MKFKVGDRVKGTIQTNWTGTIIEILDRNKSGDVIVRWDEHCDTLGNKEQVDLVIYLRLLTPLEKAML